MRIFCFFKLFGGYFLTDFLQIFFACIFLHGGFPLFCPWLCSAFFEKPFGGYFLTDIFSQIFLQPVATWQSKYCFTHCKIIATAANRENVSGGERPLGYRFCLVLVFLSSYSAQGSGQKHCPVLNPRTKCRAWLRGTARRGT